MNQQLNVELSIPIPSDKVLVSKIELEELKRQSLSGVYWNMKDLSERINKSDRWIKDNLLYNPRFKPTLEEFVYYPSQGQSWSFQAKEMSKFLDDNFKRIFKEG